MRLVRLNGSPRTLVFFYEKFTITRGFLGLWKDCFERLVRDEFIVRDIIASEIF